MAPPEPQESNDFLVAHAVRLLESHWRLTGRRRRFPTGRRCSISSSRNLIARPMVRQRFPHTPASSLQKAASAVVGLALLVLGLMFSVVLIAVLVVAGLAVWGYLWWKTREVRRILRERQAPAAANDRVFEGEATVVETEAQITRIEANGPAHRDD